MSAIPAQVTAALTAEVKRLRSDRDCEKRLRKDAEELREDAIARAERAEAELATERARMADLVADLNDACRCDQLIEQLRDVDLAFLEQKSRADTLQNKLDDIAYRTDRE